MLKMGKLDQGLMREHDLTEATWLLLEPGLECRLSEYCVSFTLSCKPSGKLYTCVLKFRSEFPSYAPNQATLESICTI